MMQLLLQSIMDCAHKLNCLAIVWPHQISRLQYAHSTPGSAGLQLPPAILVSLGQAIHSLFCCQMLLVWFSTKQRICMSRQGDHKRISSQLSVVIESQAFLP